MLAIAHEVAHQDDVSELFRRADPRAAACYRAARRSGPGAAALPAQGTRFFIARLEDLAPGWGRFVPGADRRAGRKRPFAEPAARSDGIGRGLPRAAEGAARRGLMAGVDVPSRSLSRLGNRQTEVTLYDEIGRGYAEMRRADPRIAAAISAALGDAAEVVNVGAGAGSYEPTGRTMLAIEPSDAMLQQRPPGAAACIRASAEDLPLGTGCCDAAMAVLSMHHWRDVGRGLRQMRRISRRRVVILTWVPDIGEEFWLTRDYLPEILSYDRQFFPTIDRLAALIEANIGPAHFNGVPIPHDCTDGFLGAYWQRPEAYLDPAVRGAISSFALLDMEAGLARLRNDLEGGRWLARNGHLLSMKELDLGYRIIRCEWGGEIVR